MAKASITTQQVQHVAELATIPISEKEAAQLQEAFVETLEVISNLQELDTSTVEPTHQVTGLENVWREDTIDESRMFSQAAALANADKTHQGYFVVPQVIDQD